MSSVPRFCTQCGHQLGVGRYCTNCGVRVDVPVTEAPATGVDPVQSSARYPLYADAAPAPVAPPAYDASPGQEPQPRRRVLPWVVAAAVLALVAALGVVLLATSGEDDADDPDRERGGASRADDRHSSAPPDRGPAGSLEPAEVSVPATAPSSVDEDGDRVTFRADNMLDGDPRTSWRMPGDGAGAVITFTFDEPVTITEVGLVNGYAKTDPPHDWYAGNRRIDAVAWAFGGDHDDVTQELGDSRTMQTVAVPAVETTRLELRILEVSAPGTGPDARDFTAISEVTVVGAS